MKLAEFLAVFIEQEKHCFAVVNADKSMQFEMISLRDIVQAGIEAFASTQNAAIEILTPDDSGRLTTEHYS